MQKTMTWRLWIRCFPLVLCQLSLLNGSSDNSCSRSTCSAADTSLPKVQYAIGMAPIPFEHWWIEASIAQRHVKPWPPSSVCTHTVGLQSSLPSGLRQWNLTEVTPHRAGANTPSIFLLLQEESFINRDPSPLTCHLSWIRPFQFSCKFPRDNLETLKLSRLHDLTLWDIILRTSQSTLKY